MEAIIYENFIRQVYSCSRFDVEAANADIYRTFERAVSVYDDLISGKGIDSNQGIDELCFDAAFNTGIVTAYVRAALHKAINDKKKLLSDDQLETLNEQLPLLLHKPNKKTIDQVIWEASEILISIGVTAP